jgi:hypothetical protein
LSTVPSSIGSPGCSVEVRAKELQSIGPLSWSHLFIIFTDSDGKQYVYRGGPQGNGPGGSGVLGELSGGSSQNASDASSKASTSGHSGSGSNPASSGDRQAGGPYGYIQTNVEEYDFTRDDKGKLVPPIDWDPNAKSVTVASGHDACKYKDALKQQMEEIQDAHIRYSPLGPNSNTTVFTALKNVGIKPRAPDGVWAPGASMTLNAGPKPPSAFGENQVGCPTQSCSSK